MQKPPRRRAPGWLRPAILAAAAWLVIAPSAGVEATAPPPTEVRALWVLRTSLTSPRSIASLVDQARRHGFNTLLVQVRGRGDAYYAGGLEPRAADLPAQPAFDPLATVIKEAHAAGLTVHAWVNTNLISSAVTLPRAPTHIVNRHPEWLMVPRELAQELSRVPATSPSYVQRLARWTRARADVEGLYASPVTPAAAAHVTSVIRDVVRRYDLDGVHFDYARYPGQNFDYSRAALTAFRDSLRPGLPAARRGALDTRERTVVTAYADAFPEEWRQFRIARMTALMTGLRAAVKAERPGILVSAAVYPDPREAYAQRLQDWSAWLDAGIVDVICPMAYAPDAGRFAEQVSSAVSAARGRAVWAGIGAYRLPAARTVAHIETARRLGAAGIVLFSYDSLVDARGTPSGYLTAVGRDAFAAPAPGADR